MQNQNELNVTIDDHIPPPMKIDLETPGVCTQISKRVLKDIDSYCADVYDDGHRNHLGASLIGHACKRYLWYVFRWAKHIKHDGRQQRLFNRGHREEARFIEWLRGAGFEVWESDPEGKQFRISGVMSHFGGSLDGIAKFPERYGIKTPVLLEFKTNGTGAGFKSLVEKGLILSKPMHYAQTSIYGYKYNFSHVLYLNICKNDDDLHTELVKLDHKHGAELEKKAETIILAQEPPAKLGSSTFKDCAYCDMKDICHGGKPIERNCRSCLYAKPVDNAEWFCDSHKGIIPKDFIPNACPNYIPIQK